MVLNHPPLKRHSCHVADRVSDLRLHGLFVCLSITCILRFNLTPCFTESLSEQPIAFGNSINKECSHKNQGNNVNYGTFININIP